MPTREAPAEVNEPESPAGSASGKAGAPESSASELDALAPEPEPVSRGRASSRWIDYDTHELLEMIGELEDERRWARLREGVLWAVLLHIALILALILLPKYVFKMPPVVEANLHDKSNFTYLDSPQWKPKAPAKPLIKPPVIDKQTMDEMKREAPPAPKETAPQPPPPQQVQEQPKPQPVAPPVAPTPQTQAQIEAPRPSANPARPNFAMNNSNPADQLQRDMQNAMHNRGGAVGEQSSGGLAQHPGAAGGVKILSDTQGVDFNSWLQRWHYETERTWDPLIPDEVNAPLYKSGMVVIRFKVLPNGRLMDGSVMLEGRSGDVALDRAAWGALVGSNYPPLPREFHGPFLELRAYFLYNMQPSGQ
jgi:outer membrane biosynthesis protein TonB